MTFEIRRSNSACRLALENNNIKYKWILNTIYDNPEGGGVGVSNSLFSQK
jgi:microcystin degradation protein MlrC